MKTFHKYRKCSTACQKILFKIFSGVIFSTNMQLFIEYVVLIYIIGKHNSFFKKQ